MNRLCYTIACLTLFLPIQPCSGTEPLFIFPRGDPTSNHADALKNCNGRLPDGQAAHDELVALMRSFSVWTTWLAWKRSPSPWTWVSGQEVVKSLVEESEEDSDCGVLESDGRLGSRPCHYTLPVICQFSGIPCSKTYATAYCASSNQTTLLVAPSLQGWFTARAFCQHLAGDLAIFQHEKDTTLAKAVMKKLPSGPFWVGARRNAWKIPRSKSELNFMTTNQWDVNQPGSGDCVILQQEDGRGFWRTTHCTAVHQVICTTPEYPVNGTITFSHREYTENSADDISIYRGFKKYNQTLTQLCLLAGVESPTPKELLSNMNHIAQYMRSSNINSVWLPWERKILSNWTWQNGDMCKSWFSSNKDSGRIVEDAQGLCVSPDIFLGASSMYIIPCHDKSVGYICQFNDTKPCWQRHQPYNCLQTGTTTLLFGIRVQSWYVASALCTALGSQLAQLPQEQMVQAVLNFHKKQKTLHTTNFFHIGLQKLFFEANGKEPIIVQNLWKRGEPLNNRTCSVMELEENSVLWRSAECTESHATVCRASSSTTQRPITTWEQPSENETGSFYGTLMTDKPQQSQHPLFLFAGIPLITITLAGIFLVCVCCIHRRRKLRQKQNADKKASQKQVRNSQGESPNHLQTEQCEAVLLLGLPSQETDMALHSAMERTPTLGDGHRQKPSEDKTENIERIRNTMKELSNQQQTEQCETFPLLALSSKNTDVAHHSTNKGLTTLSARQKQNDDTIVKNEQVRNTMRELSNQQQNEQCETSLLLSLPSPETDTALLSSIELQGMPTLDESHRQKMTEDEIENNKKIKSTKKELSDQQQTEQCETRPLLEPSSQNMDTAHHSNVTEKPTLCYRSDLHPERQKILIDSKTVLREKIIVEGGDLLDHLVNKNVIAEGNKRFIEKGLNNSDQVGRLLDLMLKKDDKNYNIFCDCLWNVKQGDVVSKYLSIPADFITAREKVIQYIQDEFKDIHMYTADGISAPVPMDKIYVNVTWERIRNNYSYSLKKDKPVKLQSHLEIFTKMQNYEDKRTTLSGIAGSGKTSFMKYIGRKWVEAYKNPFPKTEHSPLQFYLLLIPIILRLVQKEMSFIDIVKTQIPLLSYVEASSISRAMGILRGNILVILDGYDELTAHNVIDPIINKRTFADTSIIVTTRPHGITLLQSLGSGSIEQLFFIYGFNKDQISEYIKLFFALPGLTKESGLQLQKELLKKETYLSEMAKIPIQLEIMCIVWSIKQELGHNILNLYDNFIDCLKHHRKNKGGKQWDANSVIQGFSKLANSWTTVGSLKKIFAYEDIFGMFPSLLDGMIEFGCLVKYHPSTCLETSYWSFSHLTLQEYFLALHIGQMSNIEEETAKYFSTIFKLERLEVVLKFLCCMNPTMSNKLFKAVIKKTTKTEECKRLMKLLLKLVPAYKSSGDVDLPLPRHVALDDLHNKEELATLSLTDRRPEHRNMNSLRLGTDAVRGLSDHPGTLDISYVSYVEMMDISLIKEDKYTNNILQNARKAQKLRISGIGKGLTKDTFGHISSDVLREIKLQGEQVIPTAIEFLDVAKQPTVLTLEENSLVQEACLQELYSKLNKGTCTNMLRLTVPSLQAALVSLQSHIKVALTVKTLTKESLRMFVDRIKGNTGGAPSITQLNLHVPPLDYRNKIDDDQGGLLGRLMFCLSHLLQFSLNIDESTQYCLMLNMSELVRAVSESNTTLALQYLSLRLVYLRDEGAAVGQLVGRCPHLHTLELCICGMEGKNVEQMVASMPDSTSITRLRLAGNTDLKGEATVGRLLDHTPKIEMLDVSGCSLHIPVLLQATRQAVLEKLRVADFGVFYTTGNNFHDYDHQLEVSSYLAFMPRLQALSVAGCACTSVPALLRLIANLPPSLTHLNVCNNDFGTTVVEVTKHKLKLAQLHRLNISGQRELGNKWHEQRDEVEAIREELQEVNPDIRVYYDGDERLWDMHKDTNFKEEAQA